MRLPVDTGSFITALYIYLNLCKQSFHSAEQGNPEGAAPLSTYIETGSYRNMKNLKDIKKYLTAEEIALLEQYQKMSDEQLLARLREYAEETGTVPAKADWELAWYYNDRLGPWNRILEKAGLKSPSKTRQQRKAASRRKQQATRAKAAEARKKPEEAEL